MCNTLMNEPILIRSYQDANVEKRFPESVFHYYFYVKKYRFGLAQL